MLTSLKPSKVFSLVIAVGWLSLAPRGDVSAASLKVMTFNIKNASVEIGFDREQSWDYIFDNSNDRRARVVSVINDSAADIVGVQEMRLGQLEYMSNRLPDYA